MKARQASVIAVLTAFACTFPAAAARAAGTGVITSPERDATVTSSTSIEVQVTGQTTPENLFEERPDHDVQVRLATLAGTEPLEGTSPVPMECESNCDGDSTWTVPFDPATLAPFRAPAPSCNGGYTIQVSVDGGPWSAIRVRIAREPAAPSHVEVAASVGQARVTWQPAHDPDVAGYRVQRRPAGGGWTTVAEALPADATSLTDREVAPGEVAYRVVTLRGDGLDADGDPAAPCSDTQPELTTASAPVGATVPAEEPDPVETAPDRPARPSPTPSPTTAAPGPGDGSASEGATGTGDAGSGPGEGAASGGDGSAAPGGGTTSGDATGSGGSRVAPPEAVDTGTTPEVDVALPAGDPQVAEQDERYYGEDLEFSREMDFGDLGAVEIPGQTSTVTTTEERTIRVPGALQSILGKQLSLDRVLAPVAAGLIMLAFGLHLRRWTHAGVDR